MGTMLMGISTQLFGTSKAGVVVIAVMFVVGFFFFRLQCHTDEVKVGQEEGVSLAEEGF